MTEIQRPFANSYVVPGAALIAGEYPSAIDEVPSREKLAAVLDAGVETIVDPTTPEDGLAPYDLRLARLAKGRHVERCRMPIPDRDICDVGQMAGILDCIDTALSAGRTVYVHCWGGVG